MKRDSSGFSLLEMVVAVAIVAAVSAWTIPSYFRSLRQGEVDRYAQFIESGIFALRAKLGTSRSSCDLKFLESNTQIFNANVKDKQQTDTGYIPPDKGTDEYETLSCHPGPLIGDLLNSKSDGKNDSLRFIRVENTQESKRVQVAVSRADYELTPPGKGADSKPITFMVRSIDANEDDNLQSRCVKVSGSGHLLSGTWEGSLSSGRCLTDGESSNPNS